MPGHGGRRGKSGRNEKRRRRWEEGMDYFSFNPSDIDANLSEEQKKLAARKNYI